MKTEYKKREYTKPTSIIVELRQTGMLMTSGLRATRNGYGPAEEYEWK